MTTTNEISEVLQAAGPVFDGGTDSRRAELAAEWDDYGFDADSTQAWIDADCWDAATANMLDEAGFRPGRHALKFVEARDYPDGPMYALCNSDCTIDDVTW